MTERVIKIKKFITIMTIVILMFSLVECAKLVGIEYENVEVKITGE